MASATTNFVSAQGASRVYLDSKSQRYRVLGGMIMKSPGVSACSTSGSETCDTCDGTGSGTAPIQPCNRTAVSPSGIVQLRAHTDNTQVTAGDVHLKPTSGSGEVSGTVIPLDGNGNFGVDVTWSNICGTVSSAGTGCGNSFLATFELSIGTEKVSFDIGLSIVTIGADDNFTPCEAEGSAIAGDGFCWAVISRGDEKVYTDLSVASGVSARNGIDIRWDQVLFFYAEKSGSAASTFATMRNNGDTKSITLDNTKSDLEATDTRLTGLENGIEYCFLLSNQDETGNIYKTAPVAISPASGTPEETFCARPEQVVGLLDDKKCFIATAAFGSPMEPHVMTLRKFRDQFLKSNAPGRAFVELYYEWSPPIAKMIASSETAKAAVRTALWPLIAFASLSLELGVLPMLGLLLVLTAISLFAWMHVKRRRIA